MRNPYGNLGPSPATVRRITPPGPRVAVKPPAPAAPPVNPFARFEDQTQAFVDQLLAEIQKQKDDAYAKAQAAAQFERDKAAALATGLQQLSPAVQGIFQSAGNNQAALAQGFSGELQQQAAADAAAQQHLLSGTGQEGAVRNEGAAMGNVNYGLGGYIPASNLNAQGAAFGAQAALQPGFALQFGQDAAAKAYNDLVESVLPQFEQERLDVLQQVPSLTNDAYQRFAAERDYQDQQTAARQKAKSDALDRRYEAAALKVAYGLPLTAAEKKLINTYGLTPEAAAAAGKAKQEAADDARSLKLQKARDRAAAARQREADARRAERDARAQAARLKTEDAKFKHQLALERVKAANREKLEAQKALAKVESAAKKRSKKVGNAGDSAEASGSTGGSGFFPR